MQANWATIIGLTQPAGAAAPPGSSESQSTTATEGVPAGAPAGQEMPPSPCGAQGGTTTLVMMLAMFAIFYFLLIRPQQKKAKEHQAMLSALKKGDEVVTAGGIVGKVSGIADNLLTVEISEKVRVRVVKSQVEKFTK